MNIFCKAIHVDPLLLAALEQSHPNLYHALMKLLDQLFAGQLVLKAKHANQSFQILAANLTREARAVFVQDPDKKNVLILVDILYNHEYKRSNTFRGVGDLRARIQKIKTNPPFEKQQPDNKQEIIPVDTVLEPVIFYRDQFIFLTEEQRQAFTIRTPAIVIGVPGGGKTLCALELLLHKDGERLCLVPTLTLQAAIKKEIRQYSIQNENAIDVLTYIDFFEKFYPELMHYKKVDRENFDNWVKGKKVSYTFDLYAEFGIISGYGTVESYKQLGVNECLSASEQRESLWDLHDNYLKYLSQNGCINFSLFRFSKKMLPYSFIALDESQDMPRAMLKLFTNTPVVFFSDSNQVLNADSRPSIPYIKKLFYKIVPIQEVVLKTSYRCSASIIALANYVLRMKSTYHGGVEIKEGLAQLYCGASDIPTLPTLFIHPKEEAFEALIRQVSTHYDIVILTNKENLAEAQTIFGRRSVFLLEGEEGFKGLESERVVLYKFYSAPIFKDIGEKLKGQNIQTKITRPNQKIIQSNFHALAAFNILFTAITRGKQQVIFIEGDLPYINQCLYSEMKGIAMLGCEEEERVKVEKTRFELAQDAKNYIQMLIANNYLDKAEIAYRDAVAQQLINYLEWNPFVISAVETKVEEEKISCELLKKESSDGMLTVPSMSENDFFQKIEDYLLVLKEQNFKNPMELNIELSLFETLLQRKPDLKQPFKEGKVFLHYCFFKYPEVFSLALEKLHAKKRTDSQADQEQFKSWIQALSTLTDPRLPQKKKNKKKNKKNKTCQPQEKPSSIFLKLAQELDQHQFTNMLLTGLDCLKDTITKQLTQDSKGFILRKIIYNEKTGALQNIDFLDSLVGGSDHLAQTILNFIAKNSIAPGRDNLIYELIRYKHATLRPGFVLVKKVLQQSENWAALDKNFLFQKYKDKNIFDWCISKNSFDFLKLVTCHDKKDPVDREQLFNALFQEEEDGYERLKIILKTAEGAEYIYNIFTLPFIYKNKLNLNFFMPFCIENNPRFIVLLSYKPVLFSLSWDYFSQHIHERPDMLKNFLLNLVNLNKKCPILLVNLYSSIYHHSTASECNKHQKIIASWFDLYLIDNPTVEHVLKWEEVIENTAKSLPRTYVATITGEKKSYCLTDLIIKYESYFKKFFSSYWKLLLVKLENNEMDKVYGMLAECDESAYSCFRIKFESAFVDSLKENPTPEELNKRVQLLALFYKKNSNLTENTIHLSCMLGNMAHQWIPKIYATCAYLALKPYLYESKQSKQDEFKNAVFPESFFSLPSPPSKSTKEPNAPCFGRALR